MTSAPRPRRSKRGTLADKPVYVRLTVIERNQVEVLAAQRNRSISSMSRELIRIGTEQIGAASALRARLSDK